MRAPNYNGQNERKRAPATPPLRFLSFLQKKRNKKENKMIIFEFRNKTHYTQKGILPFQQTLSIIVFARNHILRCNTKKAV